MDQQRPAGRDARAPAADVGRRRREAVRAVDVQQVDVAVDGVERLLRRAPHMAHALGHAGTLEVRAERRVVGLALPGRPLPLPRPAVVARVRVDRDDLRAAAARAPASTIVERPR